MTKKTETSPAEAIGKIVELKKLNIQHHEIALWGTSPLIMHAWSHKAKEEMLNKQMKKASTGKKAKDPERDFLESIYKDEQGNPCFPSIAFKSSAVDAAIAMDAKKTNLRQSFHIQGEMVPILGSDPEPREDMVKVGMGVADIRYRATFKTWGTLLPVIININLLSLEQLVNLFEAAGFGIGVGEWRPQRDGQFGCFRVANDNEAKLLREIRTNREKMVANI